MISTLVTYKNLSPNKGDRNGSKIDTITIHCYVGQVTAKQGCDYFINPNIKASSNYVIGYDGSIGCSVDEQYRSWCSSNSLNDSRAVTIEVASDTKEPYSVTDKAYEALINLVTDICKRNNINKLVWSTDKNKRINHLNGCNMTVHRDYANKSCPGTYLYNKMSDIANQVNLRISTVNSNEPSEWAKESWSKACDKNIFDGTNPKSNVTREMLAVILERCGLL